MTDEEIDALVEEAVQPDEGEAPARRAGVTIAGKNRPGAMVAWSRRPQALTVDGGEELGRCTSPSSSWAMRSTGLPTSGRSWERTVADWAAQTPGSLARSAAPDVSAPTGDGLASDVPGLACSRVRPCRRG